MENMVDDGGSAGSGDGRAHLSCEVGTWPALYPSAGQAGSTVAVVVAVADDVCLVRMWACFQVVVVVRCMSTDGRAAQPSRPVERPGRALELTNGE